MHSLETWQQTAVFDPANPYQKKIEMYAGIPGQYASYYFNPVPTTSTLKGPNLLGLGTFTDGFTTVLGVVAGVALIVGGGYWAARKTGLIKKKHKGSHVAGLGWFSYRKRRR